MMRRLLIAALPVLLALGCMLASTGPGARAESGEAAEWTVMIYMCGSDLETDHGLASYNLREIALSGPPDAAMTMGEDGPVLEVVGDRGDVNVVLETGGARRWADIWETMGIHVENDRLQRYVYGENPGSNGPISTLVLADEKPLASMAAPETLSDFIRWSAETYPAEKYALVLWDHGGGSKTGIFVDELFENDIMYLCELEDALAGGGQEFEVVAIDACLMGSLETAQTIAPYARYMVASEEVAAGYGSAFMEWLNELYINPDCDGRQFGRVFCDTTLRKYAEMNDEQAKALLTYSVIDLSQIDAVAQGFDRMFDFAGQLYERAPLSFHGFSDMLFNAESYGLGGADMIDLGSVLFDKKALMRVPEDMRNELVNALTEAVIYVVKGSGRSDTRGLSFCYALNMSAEELEFYAQNCKSAPYLALLDAINAEWEAPGWVYESARRLTPAEQIDAYGIRMTLILDGDQPWLRMQEGDASFRSCDYELYRLDEDSGTLCLLGRDDAPFRWADRGIFEYRMDDAGNWPCIDGQFCSIEMVDESDGVTLYNVPIQMGGETCYLRVGYEDYHSSGADGAGNPYEVYGLWEGYDSDTGMPCRNIVPLSQVQGREFELLYPVFDEDGRDAQRFQGSETLDMYRSLEMVECPLPEGVYYCRFVVTDVFGREFPSELIRLHWNGAVFSAQH